jgi:flagellar motor switch/type III secretory pathway protein FliN
MEPWLPPRAGLDSTDAWNALVALSGQPIPLDGGSVSFALTEAPPGDAWCLGLIPRGLDVTLLAHIRAYPFRQRHEVELDVADLASLPSGLREAMYQGIVSALTAAVLSGQPGALRMAEQNVLTAFPDFAASAIQWFAVEVEVEDGLTIDLDLAADRTDLLRLIGDRLPSGSPARLQLSERIMVPADLTLGSISLTFEELAVIEPGAVVVLAERDPSTLQVRIEAQVLDLQQADDGWRCVGTQALKGFPARVRFYNQDWGRGMNDDANTAETGADSLSTDDLRVTIDFDIGRKTVPLSALSQWQAGTIVDLDPPTLADGVAVTIRANGDAVGTGDLVRIDDRIAVRVTRFLSRS